MREVIFRRQNKTKWNEYEMLLSEKVLTSDAFADIYIEITNDLAYASTYYPNSETHKYLNNLAAELHQTIYKNIDLGIC